jgi:hypothetical protein
MSARLTLSRSTAGGFLRDASEEGLLIGLSDPLLELGGDATVEVACPSSGLRIFRAAEVRRDVDAARNVVVALRLLDPPGEGATAAGTAPAPRDRPGGRAAPARPRAVVRADLSALGGQAWELAVCAPTAGVPDDLTRWLTALAAEVGAPAPEPPRTPRELLEAIRLLVTAS